MLFCRRPHCASSCAAAACPAPRGLKQQAEIHSETRQRLVASCSCGALSGSWWVHHPLLARHLQVYLQIVWGPTEQRRAGKLSTLLRKTLHSGYISKCGMRASREEGLMELLDSDGDCIQFLIDPRGRLREMLGIVG